MKKKGQFYLIAAIIIVMIIMGIVSVKNYAVTKRKLVKFYDLSEELDEESARVIDYGIYNEEKIPELIENFTDEYIIKKRYIDEKERGTELVFAYGNKDNVTLTTYTSESTGEIIISYGETPFTYTGEDKYIAQKKDLGGIESIEVEILGVMYNFTLQEGENFLFIISKKTEEETYITGNIID